MSRLGRARLLPRSKSKVSKSSVCTWSTRKRPGQTWACGPDLAGPDIGRFGGGPDLTWTSGRPKMRRTRPDLDVRSTKKRPGLAGLDVRSAKKMPGLADLRPGLKEAGQLRSSPACPPAWIPPAWSRGPSHSRALSSAASAASFFDRKYRLSIFGLLSSKQNKMSTVSKLGPHTKTDRGTCPAVGLGVYFKIFA
jgi:hypothetical protein